MTIALWFILGGISYLLFLAFRLYLYRELKLFTDIFGGMLLSLLGPLIGIGIILGIILGSTIIFINNLITDCDRHEITIIKLKNK